MPTCRPAPHRRRARRGALGCALGAALLLSGSGAPSWPAASSAMAAAGDRGEPDHDRDGISDDLDRCPERAGPMDNLGCPDRDEDGDGIIDRLDRCPTVPGSAAALGCPDVSGSGAPVTPAQAPPASPPGGAAQAAGPAQGQAAELARLLPSRRFAFAEPVKFQPGTDTLTAEGRAELESAARIILARPAARRLLIEGHVDEPGNTAARARELSGQRAEVVKRTLVGLGVAAERLRTRGLGYSKLLDRSETPAAQLRNNRIEIIILD